MTRATDAGHADAREEACIPSKARESVEQQRRRERETVRESERMRVRERGREGVGARESEQGEG